MSLSKKNMKTLYNVRYVKSDFQVYWGKYVTLLQLASKVWNDLSSIIIYVVRNYGHDPFLPQVMFSEASCPYAPMLSLV